MNRTVPTLIALLFVLVPLGATPVAAQVHSTFPADGDALLGGDLESTYADAGPYPAADQESFHVEADDGSFYLQYDNAKVADGRSGSQGVDLGSDAGDGLGFPEGAPAYAASMGLYLRGRPGRHRGRLGLGVQRLHREGGLGRPGTPLRPVRP